MRRAYIIVSVVLGLASLARADVAEDFDKLCKFMDDAQAQKKPIKFEGEIETANKNVIEALRKGDAALETKIKAIINDDAKYPEWFGNGQGSSNVFSKTYLFSLYSLSPNFMTFVDDKIRQPVYPHALNRLAVLAMMNMVMHLPQDDIYKKIDGWLGDPKVSNTFTLSVVIYLGLGSRAILPVGGEDWLGEREKSMFMSMISPDLACTYLEAIFDSSETISRIVKWHQDQKSGLTISSIIRLTLVIYSQSTRPNTQFLEKIKGAKDSFKSFAGYENIEAYFSQTSACSEDEAQKILSKAIDVPWFYGGKLEDIRKLKNYLDKLASSPDDLKKAIDAQLVACQRYPGEMFSATTLLGKYLAMYAFDPGYKMWFLEKIKTVQRGDVQAMMAEAFFVSSVNAESKAPAPGTWGFCYTQMNSTFPVADRPVLASVRITALQANPARCDRVLRANGVTGLKDNPESKVRVDADKNTKLAMAKLPDLENISNYMYGYGYMNVQDIDDMLKSMVNDDVIRQAIIKRIGVGLEAKYWQICSVRNAISPVK